MDKRTDVTLGRISGDLRSGDPFGGAISACYDRIFGIPSGITCAGNGILVPESPGTASSAAGEDSEVREDRGSALGDFCCAIIDTAGAGGRDGIWDGDDAYYVAISTAAQESGKMYQKIPYTGMNTELDVRHGLAPFPIWIAWLARMTGISTVVVTKTLLPVVLISMTYGVFYLLGSRILFSGQSVPLFLICTEVLVMFGDYSFYTVENFMIARSRQGKAALGSILIPMIFFLLLWLFRRLQEEKKITVGFWMLLGAVMISCCLASTMGALLACMLMGVAGICGAVCYKRFRLLLPLTACCIPCVIYAGMYLLLG